MKQTNTIRRFLLPCFTPPPPPHPQPIATSSSSSVAPTKKRHSASLKELLLQTKTEGVKDPRRRNNQEVCSKSMFIHSTPRASKSMVVGTIFGYRRGGHAWFCVQNSRVETRPSLLLELTVTISYLAEEMSRGVVRIVLECGRDGGSVMAAPVIWAMKCNGRKAGYAIRRKASDENTDMLKMMQSTTVGAGVIPCGSGKKIMYMRANYESVVGSSCSESFHLISPEEDPGQEFSLFFFRS